MKHRRRPVPEAASVRHEARDQATAAIERMRIRSGSVHPMRPSIAFGFSRKLLVEPDAIEELHQRKIQDIDPDDWLGAVIAVIVPSAVRSQDQVAARGLAALPVDRRITTLVRQDGSTG